MAWTYDLVAFAASLGHWTVWVRTVLTHVRGPRVLELGHGPGHLQQSLLSASLGLTVGLDASAQMGALARRHLRGEDRSKANLIRALAERLPFKDGAFDSVVATFPTPAILGAASLEESWRVLTGGGRLVVLPAAWLAGGGLLNRGAAWLFRVTRQAPPKGLHSLREEFEGRFESAGFVPEFRAIKVRSTTVAVIVGLKS